MYKDNLVAIDIAKSSFQVCSFDKLNQIQSNREIRRNQMIKWLERCPPSIVAMEACGSAHYWAKQAQKCGHKPVLISARFVKKFLDGHKTDKNDAIAIGIAARQPTLKPVSIKTDEQLSLQASERMRKHYQDCAIATSNLIRSILYEFGITLAQGEKALRESLHDILEDADNGLPFEVRPQLHQQYELWLTLKQRVHDAQLRIRQTLREHATCNELQKLDGVGPVNALGLYLALGERGNAFNNGREAAACIGVTPKQHSSGGKTVLLGISRKVAKKRLRADLIQGALAKARTVMKRPARNTLELWLKQLIERRGLRRAAVALANKTVRKAWAMLHYQQAYQAPQTLID